MKKPSLPVLVSATLIATLSGCPTQAVGTPTEQPVGMQAEDTGDTDDQTRLRTLPTPDADVRRA